MSLFGAVKNLFVELGLKYDGFTRGLKTSESEAAQTTKKIGSAFQGMGKRIAAGLSVVALTRFFKAAVQAAGVQEKAERSLADALKQSGEYTEANFARLKEYASAIQQVSTVGDETVLTLMQLGTSMGVQADQLDDAAKKAIGLSKAFGVDLKSAMKMVALARQGEYTMLQRYIPQIRGVTDETEKAAIANQAMADGWKVAQGEAQTFPGKVEQLKNAFGDLQEQVGFSITENKGLNESLTSMTELLSDPSFQKGIADIAGGLAEVLNVVVKLIAALPQLIGGLKELNVVEDQQMGVFARNAEQTELLRKRISAFFDEIKASREVRTKMQEDFGHITDEAERYNAMMLAIKKGKYGDEMAGQFTKWMDKQRKVVQETEKQIKQEPKLTRAVGATTKAVDGKTKALKGETKATEADTEATRDLLLELPKAQDIIDDLSKKYIPELAQETEDFSDLLDSNQKSWEDLMKEMYNFTGIAGAIGDAFGALGFDVGGLTQGIEKMMAGFSTGNWWDAASGMIQGVQTMITWLKQFGDFGVSQSQVARRAIEAFGDSVFLSADTIRDLAKAMEEAGITEYGEAAKKFADEWLRANGYMDDLIEKSLEFRRGWIESGGRSKDTGRDDPGGDREFGRDLPGLTLPPSDGISKPHIFAAEGFSGVVTQPTRFTVGESGPEHVQVTPGGGGGQVASIHIHNAAGAYTSQDFLRDLRIGRYTREIQDALRIQQ